VSAPVYYVDFFETAERNSINFGISGSHWNVLK